MSAGLRPGSREWLDSVVEEVIDPDAPIVDPHHHLWPDGGAMPYGLDDLLSDLASGHNVVDTVARLGERGLSDDTWHDHDQNQEFVELARAVPATQMVLDHFGTPLGVGPYESQREHIYVQWRSDIAEIACCPNVVAKIGGLAMPDNGFGWDTAERPPTSDEFLAAQGRYYVHTIEQFGPERCMFESNVPVDRRSLSYRTVWNAFRKLAADSSADERDALLRGTASRIDRL